MRAYKGYHRYKNHNVIYIYKGFFHSHSSPTITFKPNQFNISILQSTNSTPTTLTLTYRCIVPPRYIQASILHYMIWHCVPLHNEGTISFSGNLQRGNPNSVSITERERLDSSMPNNRRGGWALKCQNNRRSLLSISRPMNPDPFNPKRIISTNNCRLAYRQLSSRDGTYVNQCHANLTLFISINFNLIINIMNHYQSLH